MQDNRILAELEHPRTTGPSSSSSHHIGGGGGSTSASAAIGGASSSHHHGMTSSSSSSGAVPTSMSYSFMSSMGGVTSSTSSHALASTYDGILSGGGGGGGLMGERSCLTSGGTAGLSAAMGNVTISTSNVSPLPMRAHQMNTMPPLCQVCPSSYKFFFIFVVNLFVNVL